jgi:hypothetical protein
MEPPPHCPDGWKLIAPADAVPGDGVLVPTGVVIALDDRMFDPYPTTVRRASWAVRKVA